MRTPRAGQIIGGASALEKTDRDPNSGVEMKPIYKLSMGPGASGHEFDTLDDVNQRLNEERVVIWGDTRGLANCPETQVDWFINANNDAFFYLCHGNEEPGTGILLFGQFTGPALSCDFPGYRPNWYSRTFKRIAECNPPAPYRGALRRWWTPNFNSTFVPIPSHQLGEFQSIILRPYFNMTLEDLFQHELTQC
jgi:hypothetical protein